MSTSTANYKIRNLLCYASRSVLMGNRYQYRQVFDRSELNYLYAELSFFNKRFDEEAWSCHCRLVAYRIRNQDERITLCQIDKELVVQKEENIVFVRDGWGVPEYGSFWERGDYLWEAYIDDELVASRKFYVEDGGKVMSDHNPYFELNSLRLYNGLDDYHAILPNRRNYLKVFDSNTTRYIWVELRAHNKQKRSWYCEVFFNFFNDTGQLKGATSHLMYIPPNTQGFEIAGAWGNQSPGIWLPDHYRIEIVFMGQLIAVAPFRVDEGNEEAGDPEVFFPNKSSILHSGFTSPASYTTTTQEKNLEDLLAELNEMIGLESVKKRLYDFIHYLKFLRLRQAQGFEENTQISLHSAFLGNPGTGKTTVAKMLGKIYHKMGLLSRGTVLEVSRADLVGKFIGQTAPQTLDAINKARGGILFIDEAYALARKGDEGSQDFGKEAIEILVKEMSDGPGDLAIIMAGYPEEMQHMLNSNPGMRSRINLIYHFPDYTPQEMMDILRLKARQKGIVFQPEAEQFIYKQLVESYRGRDRSFGNARFVASLVEEAKMNLGLRIMRNAHVEQVAAEDLRTVQLEDVKPLFARKRNQPPDIPIDEDLLQDALQQLYELIGLENVKSEVNELVKLVRFYRESGRDVLHRFSLHAVFTGNPGTGKTTVARIMAQIYKALGILERGHLVECDRQALVAGYVGQTAIKTQQKINEALGGVLFIDEAYALGGHTENDFGREAIEVLLKQMEDRRGELIVIVAGYPDNMQQFLHANPGLLSRFDINLHFEDYSIEDLCQIALKMLEKEELYPDWAAWQHLQSYLAYLHQHRNKFFGNARTVRKVIQQAIRNQHLRMASLPKEARTADIIRTLTMDDLKEFVITEQSDVMPKLGFRLGKGGALG